MVCSKNCSTEQDSPPFRSIPFVSKTEYPKRKVLGQGLRESKGSVRSAQERQEGDPMQTDTDAAGACFGRREETQITEVAAQKGNLQNGDFLKSSVLSCLFQLSGGGKRKNFFIFVLLWW